MNIDELIVLSYYTNLSHNINTVLTLIVKPNGVYITGQSDIRIFQGNRYQAPGMLLLRGTRVNRTYGTHKNPYLHLFLLTIFGPIYYGPP